MCSSVCKRVWLAIFQQVVMGLRIRLRSDVFYFFVRLALLVCPCRGLEAHGNLTLASHTSGSALMLVAGISATSEMCMTVIGGNVGLESCLAAVAAGDGLCVITCAFCKLHHCRTTTCVHLRVCMCARGSVCMRMVMTALRGAISFFVRPRVVDISSRRSVAACH